MTLILDLPPEMESRLSDEAALAGVSPDKYAFETLKRRLKRSKSPSLSSRERDLLNQIKSPFSEEFWRRYNELKDKLWDETFSPDEQEEAVRYAGQVEGFAASRLEALLELSKLWNMSLDHLMKRLGIENPRCE